MRLSKINLTSDEVIEFKIDGASPSDPYLLKGADGLGPTEVPRAVDRGIVSSGGPLSRSMVIRAGLNPDYGTNQTVDDLRTDIYRLLAYADDGMVTVGLYEGAAVHSAVTAYVSKIEVVLFDKEPVIQITLDCDGAYFVGTTEEVETWVDKSSWSITNPGTARTGFELSVEFTTAHASGWTLSRGSSDLFFDWSFDAGDILSVGTQENSRYVLLDRSGVVSNIIESLTASRVWLDLVPGVNAFSASDTNYTNQEIRFYPRYLGV